MTLLRTVDIFSWHPSLMFRYGIYSFHCTLYKGSAACLPPFCLPASTFNINELHFSVLSSVAKVCCNNKSMTSILDLSVEI